MMCLCTKTYYDRNTFEVVFQKGKYYKHLGAREMLSGCEVPNGTNKHGYMIVGFGKLDSWKLYFEEPSETRDRKLTELGI